MAERDWSVFACPNPQCSAFGQRGLPSIHPHGWSSKPRGIRCLRCTVCGQSFSERKGTPLFGARLPRAKLLAVLAHLADGCGVRQTARLAGVGKNTVSRLGLLAGAHARRLHDELVGFSPLDYQGPAR